MKNGIAWLFIVILNACNINNNTSWHTLDFGAFILTTPSDWEIVKQQGVDSYVGLLTNGKDSLCFEYGTYSAGVGDENPKAYRMAIDTVNGLLAKIAIPVVSGKGMIAMSIAQFHEPKMRFYIYGFATNTLTTLKIFKSIKFPESNTAKNPTLTIDKFTQQPTGSIETLYRSGCPACHHPMRDATGPMFRGIPSRRSSEWIYKFMTHKSLLKNDTAYITLIKERDSHCPELSELSEADVQELVDFMR